MGRFQRHTVPLWSISSCSRGAEPSVSSGSSAISRDSGISAGNSRTFSSKRSNIEVIQRSPNHTRGRTPWVAYSGGRVSRACTKVGMRVSCHSRLPSRNGEFAASATCGPAIACAAFQEAANCSGGTCRCSCIEVQADSGAIESKVRSSPRPFPSPSMLR